MALTQIKALGDAIEGAQMQMPEYPKSGEEGLDPWGEQLQYQKLNLEDEGTSKEGDPAPAASAPVKATTPKLAMKNMQKALLAGDGEAYANCHATENENEKKGLACMGDVLAATLKFQIAMEKEYNNNAYSRGLKRSIGDLTDENWPETLRLTIDGDSATASLRRSIPMVKKDGVWWLESPRTVGNLKRTVQQAEMVVKVFRSAQAKIGKEGYTPERIYKEKVQETLAGLKEAGRKSGQ